MYRWLILLFVMGVAVVSFRYALRSMVEQRIKRKGEELRKIGISFNEWLYEAKVSEEAFTDKSKRSEIIEQLMNAADSLLRKYKR